MNGIASGFHCIKLLQFFDWPVCKGPMMMLVSQVAIVMCFVIPQNVRIYHWLMGLHCLELTGNSSAFMINDNIFMIARKHNETWRVHALDKCMNQNNLSHISAMSESCSQWVLESLLHHSFLATADILLWWRPLISIQIYLSYSSAKMYSNKDHEDQRLPSQWESR